MARGATSVSESTPRSQLPARAAKSTGLLRRRLVEDDSRRRDRRAEEGEGEEEQVDEEPAPAADATSAGPLRPRVLEGDSRRRARRGGEEVHEDPLLARKAKSTGLLRRRLAEGENRWRSPRGGEVVRPSAAGPAAAVPGPPRQCRRCRVHGAAVSLANKPRHYLVCPYKDCKCADGCRAVGAKNAFSRLYLQAIRRRKKLVIEKARKQKKAAQRRECGTTSELSTVSEFCRPCRNHGLMVRLQQHYNPETSQGTWKCDHVGCNCERCGPTGRVVMGADDIPGPGSPGSPGEKRDRSTSEASAPARRERSTDGEGVGHPGPGGAAACAPPPPPAKLVKLKLVKRRRRWAKSVEPKVKPVSGSSGSPEAAAGAGAAAAGAAAAGAAAAGAAAAGEAAAGEATLLGQIGTEVLCARCWNHGRDRAFAGVHGRFCLHRACKCGRCAALRSKTVTVRHLSASADVLLDPVVAGVTLAVHRARPRSAAASRKPSQRPPASTAVVPGLADSLLEMLRQGGSLDASPRRRGLSTADTTVLELGEDADNPAGIDAFVAALKKWATRKLFEEDAGREELYFQRTSDGLGEPTMATDGRVDQGPDQAADRSPPSGAGVGSTFDVVVKPEQQTQAEDSGPALRSATLLLSVCLECETVIEDEDLWANHNCHQHADVTDMSWERVPEPVHELSKATQPPLLEEVVEAPRPAPRPVRRRIRRRAKPAAAARAAPTAPARAVSVIVRHRSVDAVDPVGADDPGASIAAGFKEELADCDKAPAAAPTATAAEINIDSRRLWRMLAMDEPPPRPRRPCPLCPDARAPLTELELEGHMFGVHGAQADMECPLCQCGLRDRGVFDDHMRREHQVLWQQRWQQQCCECRQEFYDSRFLRAHEEQHMQILPMARLQVLAAVLEDVSLSLLKAQHSTATAAMTYCQN